ncbi:AAA family ATPase [Candidatus Oscillochloris fontis]|uniref:AAA family ATPase n=1 Tax=Candidatus Oscillochloris fontis TaxID=2496868 RepID=UPI00101D3127|nr:DUF3696 domain-containing protein [Candidatus Oscillochloris fontis]
MITSLHLQNFKCFSDQRIAFGPLTLLVGANASGKSSVIQSLLLLRQSHIQQRLQEGKLLLAGPLVNVGTASDIYSLDPIEEEEPCIHLGLDEVDEIHTPFRFQIDTGDQTSYVLHGTDGPYHPGNLFQPAWNYLNAERIGPRLLYPLPTDDRWPNDVGIHGEYAPFILGRSKQRDLIANDAALADDRTGEIESRSLTEQVRLWMRQIIADVELKATLLNEADQVKVMFGNRGPDDLVRPTNIGFGLIYTLPIVVAALVAPPGSLLIIENPEAHLHPRSQSIMGRFLARVAAAGVQVVVETHSDHILNGIRVAVRQGAWGQAISADDVVIQYFIAANDGRPLRVRQPRLYADGGIDPWPRGFFDQMDDDLRELL